MKNKNQKGITLVALVITIIVLLILAGVAINMAINSGGLFGKANEAVEKYDQARKNESTAISNLFDTLTEIETGVKVEQVTDAKPGELEGNGTEADPYTINSIEDLVFFSYDVRQGNTYAEKTVKLGTNLDFNSSKSYVDPYRKDYGKYGYNGELKTLLISGEGFIPIGTTSNLEVVPYSFAGTFDGQGNKIINLYMNKTTVPNKEMRIGLFGNNKGTIKNVGIVNGEITLTMNGETSEVGAFAGKNYNAIENCYYIGNNSIYAEDTVKEGKVIRMGGMVSGNETGASMKNCYHIGKLNLKNKSTATCQVGGITATNKDEFSGCYSSGSIEIETNGDTVVAGIAAENTKTISNCYNTKDIVVRKCIDNISIGGIVGNMTGNYTPTMYNCYNLGDFTATADVKYYGGIMGNVLKNSTIYNCYNLGNTTGNIEYAGGIIGQIGGSATEITNFSNCCYLSSNATKGIGRPGALPQDNDLTEGKTEIKSDEIITLFNASSAGAWKADTNKINDGYPILSWQ